MQFAIKCETYCRLTNILRRFKPDETRDCFRAIYVERRNGNLIAVATNGEILAAELIERKPGPDEQMYMTIDPALIAQAISEEKLGSSLHVVNTPALQYAAIKSTYGYQYAGNGAVFPKTNVTEKWRSIVDHKETAAPMITNAYAVADLGFASPSGVLVFPEVIDGSKPVIVHDRDDPNWIGMFMPLVFEDGKRVKRPAATYPEWAK